MRSVLIQRLMKAACKVRLFALTTLRIRNSKSVYYFGYGANIDPDYMLESGLQPEFIDTAKLTDQRLEFSMPCEYKGVGYASIVPSSGDIVWGSLFRISSAALDLLDIMEWVPFGAYSRKTMPVSLGSGITIDAQVYIAANPRVGLAPPEEYLRWIIESGRKIGLPADYLSHLAEQGTCEPTEIDHSFNLIAQNRPRPGIGNRIVFRIYRITDRLRERLAEIL